MTPRELCDSTGGRDSTCSPSRTTPFAGGLRRPTNFAAYLDELDAEAARAAALYGLLVLPGLELTYDDPDPTLAGHASRSGCAASSA